MKGSLATSTVLHVLVLGAALSSFTAPRTLEVADVESFPVSIVPVEEITQIQQGEKTAPIAERAAPTPTTSRPGAGRGERRGQFGRPDVQRGGHAQPQGGGFGSAAQTCG
jgi:hypothetical protein